MQTVSRPQRAGSRLYRYSAGEYDRMAELGFFNRQRVELVEGMILMMAPQYEPHVAGVSLAARAVEQAFGPGFWVRRQSPILLGKRSKPEPDVAVVAGSENDYIESGPPTDPLLLIEVSDSTLRLDRGRKAFMYAKHGVTDYWILNLVDRQLEVHRDPIADRSRRPHFRYRSIEILKPGDSIAPLSAPTASIAVALMLPLGASSPRTQ